MGEGACAPLLLARPGIRLSGMISPVPVGAVEEPSDVMPHRRPQWGEASIVAGPAQVLDRGLGEILVAVADRGRHVDVFDVGGTPEGRENRPDTLPEDF